MKENQYTLLKQEILEKYKKYAKNRPYIIAIDGLSGAGKTTLVQNLKQTFEDKIVVIHIDEYIEETTKRYHTGHEEWFEYYQLQWDVEGLKENLFKKLHNNETKLYLPYYDWDKDRVVPKLVQVEPSSIVLVEGVFLLREEWKSYFDYVIFLDCPQQIRHKRSVQRDQYIGDLAARLKKYENRYWPAEEYYMGKLDPLKHADRVWQYREDGENIASLLNQSNSKFNKADIPS